MNKRSTKFYRKNEAEVMKRLGFKPTKNSGAGWIEKEDGQNEQCICQLKSTDKQSISIKQNDIHILEQNAAISHKLPVFALQFLNTGEVWVMIKPEDLSLIQSLVAGEDISEQLNVNEDLFCGTDLGVDNEDDTCYNVFVGGRNAGKSYLARQAYMKQKGKEREQQEQEFKQRMKEKNRERRKQVGKEIQTKGHCNL
jgi:hypothetical protein